MKGDLKSYGTVWYNPEGIANILSLHNFQKMHKVTYESSMMTRFKVHSQMVLSICLNLNTVHSIKSKYTAKQLKIILKA